MRKTARLELRLTAEEKGILEALAGRHGLSASEWVRSRIFTDESVQPGEVVPYRPSKGTVAVEQALGSRGGPPAASGGDGADSGFGRAPAPAEPPEEPYVPEWKKRSLGSRPHGPVPKESMKRGPR